ncbi:NAD(P)H-dependent oxidoreductase [Pseudomonas sp. BN102]|uniref:FMN-dependent NADH-azoreductase n=1 Tax=Pseudomonas sp. BN102 TaxID=2567886 RepID=UPI00245566FE|nr:NAD(P)H-dependent oxidoreductase [Pseudomonas sp. BN102]MDH4609801.1 FMN-dependent NADH-azoreductase [Pseudomonas sp. BN102]
MSTILSVQGSPRGERSHSRRLQESFLKAWQARQEGRQVLRREVGRVAIPLVTEGWIAASFHPESEARSEVMKADLAVSDLLVDELLAADGLVISAPMYNFSVPAGVKAWIDQVMRVRRTFGLDLSNPANPYTPLVLGRKALIITTRGDHGYGPGGANAHMNHADTYLRLVLGHMGITDATVVAVEDDEFGGEGFQQSYQRAERALADLAETF